MESIPVVEALAKRLRKGRKVRLLLSSGMRVEGEAAYDAKLEKVANVADGSEVWHGSTLLLLKARDGAVAQPTYLVQLEDVVTCEDLA